MAEKLVEEELTELLLKNKMQMATAESCTGGLAAARMINVPGVSAVFKEGFITYANEAKVELLGVREETLAQYGAVSRQTAEEMVRGTALKAGVEAAIATTGIAGPDGGTPEKPVGLVYIGCYLLGKVTVEEHHFTGSRMQVRESAAECALRLLCRCIAEAE